ncbi:hypothetical protein Cch01nite_25620 [Cellulomonas chitinilytica]|uniref:M23ase beta-sheet core domain-containing protein n=1 Tax=Cellulomonas chitinilytica TaxID=398759 RepID=A0A919P4L9_9CELL|nr:hypothetical protein Cch01nite_25620 [Cellulomonas chitinilytica]
MQPGSTGSRVQPGSTGSRRHSRAAGQGARRPPDVILPSARASVARRSRRRRQVALAGLGAVLCWLAVVIAGSAAAPQSLDGVVTFRPPVPAPLHVRDPFRSPPAPWAAGHRGVDLAADAGTPLLAPAAGVVTFAGEIAGRGVVVVTHPGGLRSSLEPAVATVPVGTAVAAGDPVATLAGTGSHCAPASCVHWGVRRGSVYLNPMGVLGAPGPIVLLSDGPLDSSAGPDEASQAAQPARGAVQTGAAMRHARR